MNAPQIKMSKGVSIKKCVEDEVFPYPLRHSKLSLAFHTADLGAMRYITLHENQGSRAHNVSILSDKKEFLDHLHFYWSSLATDIVSNKIIFCNFFIYFLFLFFRHALR